MGLPGKLEVAQTYNDAYRGWPVAPVDEPHPIRGSFMDPRPDPELGAIYHDGVDIAVRDDRPERDAPQGRTHRVYAIEGGEVRAATARGVRGLSTLATSVTSMWRRSSGSGSGSSRASHSAGHGRAPGMCTSASGSGPTATASSCHFAPGTEQNLPANGCMDMHRTVRRDGIYWFRLFPHPYWDTTTLPNGRYSLRIRAWDIGGNTSTAESQVTIRN